jgi:DNA-binding MarR family transcriptional regulator
MMDEGVSLPFDPVHQRPASWHVMEQSCGNSAGPSALFKTLVRSSGGMTKQLDKLSSQGLIVRVPDEEDRRSLLVELTEKGLTLVDRALTDHMANEKAVLAKLNAAQTRSLAKALQIMIDQLV